MKSLDNYIIEKLVIHNNSKIKNKGINSIAANYVINNIRELVNLDELFDRNTILPFIKAYITQWPLYIWETTEDKFDENDKLTKLIIGYRELHGVSENQFKQIIPKSISGDKGIAVVLRDDKTKYTEIYVKNHITKKRFFILQE